MEKEYRLSSDPLNVEYLIDYEKELNESQLEAVLTVDGPLLCIAGAGSGKTRTLIYRVARMVESGIPPDSIVLLTFTRKAAFQMLNRTSELVGDKIRTILGGTYHSVAYRLLRKYGSCMGLPPDFMIMDESDSSDLINLVRGEVILQHQDTRFPNKNTLKDLLSASINRGLDFEAAIKREIPQFIELSEEIIKIFSLYSEYKNKNRLLDYDDLLTTLITLLEENEEARKIVHEKFRYFLVDEYQDTNLLQAKLTRLLGEKCRNVMAVGDDFQSIYSFRGADYRNIFRFSEFFPESKIVRLEENYRSTSSILDATNCLMTHAAKSFRKTLFTERKGGEKPVIIPCSNEDQQARFVAQRILELREEGISLSEMAVLFRSGFHAYQLELELQKRKIPYQKWGGFKFLEAAHIKDILAHLRILLNPCDHISWTRVLSLIDGIGSKTIKKFLEVSGDFRNGSFLEENIGSPRSKPGLVILGQYLKKSMENLPMEPASLLNFAADYYNPLLKKKFDDYPKRMKDLDHLSVIAGKYKNLETFLTDLALEPPSNSVNGNLKAENEKEEESLVISTIHSAKGMEWNSVFIICAIEGRFPPFYSMDDPENIEEERRLMYVAMTRAKENLFISYPSNIYDHITRTVFSEPTRFLGEIGEEYFQKWNIREG
ncbi:MAG: ATP-dependent helicase [Candidatus Riflebacteria bacterium]|nr:ATP-dependent helicase [Candidatus Riflebacteria bacterium]